MTKSNADLENDTMAAFEGDADIDFGTIPESAAGAVLPPDTYNAIVLDVEKKQGEKGPYYNWKFGITDEPYQDVKVYRVTSLAEKAADSSFKTLQVILGAAIPRGKFSLAAYYDRFIGRAVRLKIKPREWNGTMQNDVERILPATSSTGENTRAGANSLF